MSKKRSKNGGLWLFLLGAAIIMAALVPPLVSGGSSVTPRVLYTPSASKTPTVTVTPAYTPVPTPTPIPTPAEYILYSKKNIKEKIDNVSLVQARLKQLGYYAGEADGMYGDSTLEAVVNFQRMNQLTIDGMAGETTQRMLFENENVLDASGRVYVPFVESTPTTAPTPTPAPIDLIMTDFSGGSETDPRLHGGTRYEDSTVSAEISIAGETITAKVRIIRPSQFRSALAGSLSRPARAEIDALAKKVNAVIAFAGTPYETGGIEARQGMLLSDSRVNKPLVIIDENAVMSVFDASYSVKALESMQGHIYQAMSAETALIINGVGQPRLSQKADGRVTALGQTKQGDYIIINGAESPQIISEKMERLGADNAVIVSKGGLYTGFGYLTQFTHKAEQVSNILYFAALSYTGEDE